MPQERLPKLALLAKCKSPMGIGGDRPPSSGVRGANFWKLL